MNCYPGDSSAAYGTPLIFNSQKTFNVSRQSFVNFFQSKGVNVHIGPIRPPIHLRPSFHQNISGWFRPTPHPSHRKGSCPVTECRCEFRELFLYSAIELDKIKIEQAKQVVNQILNLFH